MNYKMPEPPNNRKKRKDEPINLTNHLKAGMNMFQISQYLSETDKKNILSTNYMSKEAYESRYVAVIVLVQRISVQDVKEKTLKDFVIHREGFEKLVEQTFHIEKN
jgi:hypothetical protein